MSDQTTGTRLAAWFYQHPTVDKTERTLANKIDEAMAAQRAKDAAVADAHECGGEDDIICQGQNCGMIISAAIENGES